MTTNNHPAHGPVSLDRLHQIRERLSKAAAQSDGGNLGYAMADAVKVIDGVIAAFGAEPVGYFYADKPGDWYQISDGDRVPSHRRIPLYANPQSSPVVPDTLPCPVHLEPGLKFGKGVRTQCMLDALRRRADYYAELETMTPEQRAEHDAGIAEFKSMLGNAHGKSDDEIGSWNNHVNTPTIQAGNSPLKWGLRDGIEAIRNSGIPVDVDKIQSECMAGNSPVTPDTWIPVSERMPEPNTYVLVSNGVWVGQGAYNDSDHLDDDEHWQDEHHEFINLLHHPVTHWQPLPAAPNFRENVNSSTKHFREIAETSTNCPRCGGRGTYHCPQMLGTVECECALPAAPKEVEGE